MVALSFVMRCSGEYRFLCIAMPRSCERSNGPWSSFLMDSQAAVPLIGNHQFSSLFPWQSNIDDYVLSQICSRIAASGHVVLAIEHRDGTAPACITRKWITDNIRTPRVVRYLREEDVR